VEEEEDEGLEGYETGYETTYEKNEKVPAGAHTLPFPTVGPWATGNPGSLFFHADDIQPVLVHLTHVYETCTGQKKQDHSNVNVCLKIMTKLNVRHVHTNQKQITAACERLEKWVQRLHTRFNKPKSPKYTTVKPHLDYFAQLLTHIQRKVQGSMQGKKQRTQ
jgi:hypothetical protein